METLVKKSQPRSESLFARILVGVDGSQASLEAVAQAAILQEAGRPLALVCVWSVAPAIIGATGSEVPPYFDEELQREQAEEAVRVACARAAPMPATASIVYGTPWDELIRELGLGGSTLIAVGGSRSRRLRGILTGSVAAEIVHWAPCSVLVARRAGEGFPRRVVVGVDGSAESAAAYAAARSLVGRFGCELTPLVADGGRRIDARRVSAITGEGGERSAAGPTDALVRASGEADLIVVGSRGLHGVRALGSVSERVAAAAVCSTLIVRDVLAGRG